MADFSTSELIAEVQDRQAEWERIYGKPNYPDNLALAVRLADALASLDAEVAKLRDEIKRTEKFLRLERVAARKNLERAEAAEHEMHSRELHHFESEDKLEAAEYTLDEVELRLLDEQGYAPEDRIRFALLHIEAHRENKIPAPEGEVTDEDVAVFKTAWEVADAEGDTGNRVRRALTAVAHPTPTKPDWYLDGQGEPWELRDDGHWYDKDGETRDTSWNYMLAAYGPWTVAPKKLG